jgi:hypothetical protein
MADLGFGAVASGPLDEETAALFASLALAA